MFKINQDVVLSLDNSYNPGSSISEDGLTWSSGRNCRQCIRTNKGLGKGSGIYFEISPLSYDIGGYCTIGIGNEDYWVTNEKGTVVPTNCIAFIGNTYQGPGGYFGTPDTTSSVKYTRVDGPIGVGSTIGFGVDFTKKIMEIYCNDKLGLQLSYDDVNITGVDASSKVFISLPWDSFSGSVRLNFGKDGFKYEETAKRFYRDIFRVFDTNQDFYAIVD